MQSQKRIFDDIAKVAGGALGALGSLKQEIEVLVRQRVERFLADGDFVTREEFEAVKAMASEARAEQVRLLTRLETLEGASPKTTGSASNQTPPRKSPAKKTARKTARKPAAKK